MKIVREYINEANFKDILKPVPQEEVLDSIAHMSQKEKDGRLLSASIKGNTKIADLLLKAGADVNAKDNDGWTTLMWALFNENMDMMELLLKAGADVNAKSNEGNRILWFAMSPDQANLLKQYGAK